MANLQSADLASICDLMAELRRLERRISSGIKHRCLDAAEVNWFMIKLEKLQTRALGISGINYLAVDSKVHNLQKQLELFLKHPETPINQYSSEDKDVPY